MSDIVIAESTDQVNEVFFATELLFDHWDEIAKNKDLMKLNPDFDKYTMLDKLGKMFTVTARDAEGKLIGYSVNIVDNHLHYRDLKFSSNDVLFVAHSHRNSSVFMRLKAETKRIAKERGAQLQFWHAKEGSALAAILPRQGCKIQDIIFSEEL